MLKVIEKKKIVKKHLCKFCNTLFTKKTTFETHIKLCEKLSQSKYKEKIEDEENNAIKLPSQKQIYKIIQDLVCKCEKLENEVSELKTYIQKTKKQINVLEWLNENMVNSSIYGDFFDFIRQIEITRKEMMYLIDYDYIDGIYMILEQYLALDNTEAHPIKSFQQNVNIMYIYVKNQYFNIDDGEHEHENSIIQYQTQNKISVSDSENDDDDDDDDNENGDQEDKNTTSTNTSNQTYLNKYKSNPYIWRVFKEDDISKMLFILDCKLWKVFIEYKKEHQKQIDKNDDLYHTFNEYSQKVCGDKKTKDQIHKGIKARLYQYLKLNLKNILELEFTF